MHVVVPHGAGSPQMSSRLPLAVERPQPNPTAHRAPVVLRQGSPCFGSAVHVPAVAPLADGVHIKSPSQPTGGVAARSQASPSCA